MDDKLLMNSNYPFEKVIFFKEGKYITQGYEWIIDVNPLGKMFLPQIVISFDNWQTFEEVYPALVDDQYIGCLTLGSGREVSYRYWGYAMEDIDDDTIAPETSSRTKDDFILSTDSEQYRVHSTQRFTLPTGQTKTIRHNLGFAPIAKMWSIEEDSEGKYLQEMSSLFAENLEIRADESILSVKYDGANAGIELIVRIYANEAK